VGSISSIATKKIGRKKRRLIIADDPYIVGFLPAHQSDQRFHNCHKNQDAHKKRQPGTNEEDKDFL
jgi:hypothetical protein